MEPRFVPNEVTADLYRQYTISFPGGSIKATKDVLASMFERENLPDTCNPEQIEVSRKQSTWTAYPGAPSRLVDATTYIKKNYSNGGTSKAAGGEPIKVLINNDWWTARLTGSHQAFMDFLCDNRSSLRDGFTYWKSQAGKPYSLTDNSTSGQ